MELRERIHAIRSAVPEGENGLAGLPVSPFGECDQRKAQQRFPLVLDVLAFEPILPLARPPYSGLWYTPVFEPYERRPTSLLPPLVVSIREATAGDAAVLGPIAQERHGGELEPHVRTFERQIKRAVHDNDLLILVAEADGEIIAFGRAGFHHWRTPEDKGVPEGWYLLGVVVRPAYRRRGVARELTRRRLEWLDAKCNSVYYFANAQNRASIELHEAFGFREVTRDFSYPGVEFTGGEGILFMVR